MVADKRYITHRKKGLLKLNNLVSKRDALNKRINKIRKELGAWDNAVIIGANIKATQLVREL